MSCSSNTDSSYGGLEYYTRLWAKIKLTGENCADSSLALF